jgi:uncharacterized protein (TIGR02271 family)
MSQTVIGLFDDAEDARDAVEKLTDRGFDRSQIDCSPTRTGDSNMGTSSDSRDDDHDDNAITRFFKNLFGDDDDEATKYSTASRNRSIVTVHARSEEEASRAAEILDDEGAINVDEHGSNDTYRNSDAYRGTDNLTATDRSSDREGEQRIDVVEENLEVGKREVETGGVSVRSRIVERPVEENIRLRNERVWVEREAVDRPASTTDNDAFRERNIELTEKAEIPVVNKEARVVEEIRVGKETEERNETIHDTVKKTEVDVDKRDSDMDLDTDINRRKRDM